MSVCHLQKSDTIVTLRQRGAESGFLRTPNRRKGTAGYTESHALILCDYSVEIRHGDTMGQRYVRFEGGWSPLHQRRCFHFARSSRATAPLVATITSVPRQSAHDNLTRLPTFWRRYQRIVVWLALS